MGGGPRAEPVGRLAGIGLGWIGLAPVDGVERGLDHLPALRLKHSRRIAGSALSVGSQALPKLQQGPQCVLAAPAMCEVQAGEPPRKATQRVIRQAVDPIGQVRAGLVRRGRWMRHGRVYPSSAVSK